MVNAKNFDSKDPDSIEPDSIEPDAKEPDSKEPDAKEPESKKPDARESASGESASKKLDSEELEVEPEILPLQRYKPVELLGQGALGRVYLCLDRRLGKTVAVKCLLSITDDRVVSFHNEAKIASRLHHESIIQILDFGITDGGRPFMVMEYFPSRSLQDVLVDEGLLPEGEALELFLLVARALACLHSNNVFHRDLKPSNVLVGTTEQDELAVRLIDFNLSKTSQDVQSKTFVQGRTVVGTPAYMSPDQVAGQPYDAKSEVYSMGCLMYEVLTGLPPFQGETALEVLNLHAHAEVVPPTELIPEISRQTAEIVEKCLSKDRDDRYQSFNDLISDLERALEHFVHRSTTGGGASSGDSGHSFVDGTAGSDQRKRFRTVLLISIAFCTLAAAALSVLSLKQDPKQSDKSLRRSIAGVDSNKPVGEITDSFTEHLSNSSALVKSAIRTGEDTVNLPYTCMDNDLKLLRGVTSVKDLYISDSPGVTDKCIPYLVEIPNLRKLELEGTRVKTLMGINKLRKLILLSVDRAPVTDEAMDNINNMKNLFWLRMHETKVTDSGIQRLAGLDSLSDLDLSNTAVTDACLPSLAKHKRLAYLNLNGTAATPAGVRKLLLLLKKIQIVDVSENKNFRRTDIASLRLEFPRVNFAPKEFAHSLNLEEQADALQAKGRYREAISLYERCARESGKEITPKYIRYQDGIMTCYEKMGKWKQSIKTAEEFGRLAEEQKKMSDATVGYRRAYEIAKAINDLSDKGAARDNFAISTVIKNAEALNRLTEAEFGKNSVEASHAEMLLGDTYMQVGRYRDAIQPFTRVSEFSRKALAQKYDPVYVAPIAHLGEAYRYAGKKREAHLYFNEALDLLRKGFKNRSTVKSAREMFFMAAAGEIQMLHDGTGNDLKKALKLSTEALEVLESCPNPNAHAMQSCLTQRVSILVKLGRTKESEVYQQKLNQLKKNIARQRMNDV
jgi:serine/threonine protein kinase/tetratricopeptide (TPR) repeat protein